MTAESLIELLHGDEPPVEFAAIYIARDAHPDIDVAGTLHALDALAAGVSFADAAPPAEHAARLARHVYETHGFHGNADDYGDPRNSYLDDVLARRTGIPITLAVVLMAVGRRAGLLVEGIGFPGHFLARVGGASGVLVDPFHAGRVVDRDALDRLATVTLGSASRLRDEHLAPATTRAIAARMLLNLKTAHEGRGDHPRALVVCDRLVDLAGQPDHRRDRGLHALALGAHRAAESDLAAYLAAKPDASDARHVTEALERARRGAASTRAALA